MTTRGAAPDGAVDDARGTAPAAADLGDDAASANVIDGGGATDRAVVDVAVGVLVERDADGRDRRFLLTSRPPGKVYAGHWEFPGGKLEPGESVEAALARELHEELGIAIDGCEPWHVERFDYPHARVRLHFCKVTRWHGAFEMREGQQMAWQTLPVTVAPVLAGTRPVLRWFAAEWGHDGALGDEPPAPCDER